MSVDSDIAKIADIAAKLEAGKEEWLGALRGSLVDLSLVDVAPEISERTLVVLYMTRKLLNDLWTNVGTDASFGFPEPPDEEYVLVEELSQALGEFVRVGLSGGNDVEESQILDMFTRGVGCYYRLIGAIQERATQTSLEVL